LRSVSIDSQGGERVRRSISVVLYPVPFHQGTNDKRLMIIETEFAGAPGALRHEGNILSRMLRDAYDGRILATLTKNNPMKATGGHVSVIAHVTVDECRRLVDQTSLSKVFCNRFLHVLVRRSQELPFGSELDEQNAQRFASATREVIEMARTWNRVDFTEEARELPRPPPASASPPAAANSDTGVPNFLMALLRRNRQ
jgi:hypothetical protein